MEKNRRSIMTFLSAAFLHEMRPSEQKSKKLVEPPQKLSAAPIIQFQFQEDAPSTIIGTTIIGMSPALRYNRHCRSCSSVPNSATTTTKSFIPLPSCKFDYSWISHRLHKGVAPVLGLSGIKFCSETRFEKFRTSCNKVFQCFLIQIKR